MKLQGALTGLWNNWHEDLAHDITELGEHAMTLRDQLLATIGRYRSTVTQLALLDSRYAPLSALTNGDSGLTVRNNDEIGITIYHLERITFTPNARTQPGRWLEWALTFNTSTQELENN